MKIKENETNLDSKKLQQLFCLVHKVVAKYEGRLRQWKYLKVYMSYYNGAGYRCKATIGGTNIWMRMDGVYYNQVYYVAQVFAHELYHSYGFHHSGFRRFPLDEKQLAIIKKRFPDMKSFWKPKIEKPVIDQIAVKYKRLQNRLKSWERKSKMANTRLKKIKIAIRRYEKLYNDRIN